MKISDDFMETAVRLVALSFLIFADLVIVGFLLTIFTQLFK